MSPDSHPTIPFVSPSPSSSSSPNDSAHPLTRKSKRKVSRPSRYESASDSLIDVAESEPEGVEAAVPGKLVFWDNVTSAYPKIVVRCQC